MEQSQKRTQDTDSVAWWLGYLPRLWKTYVQVPTLNLVSAIVSGCLAILGWDEMAFLLSGHNCMAKERQFNIDLTWNKAFQVSSTMISEMSKSFVQTKISQRIDISESKLRISVPLKFQFVPFHDENKYWSVGISPQDRKFKCAHLYSLHYIFKFLSVKKIISNLNIVKDFVKLKAAIRY